MKIMTNDELGQKMKEYCMKFQVPLEFLFEILEDQKVTPMIRGKATEYNMFLELSDILPRSTWSVQKLNLNAQTGTHDEDISITHRRTGIILKVESKSCVRGSITDGKKSKKVKVPHFKVKCHRSRSNISLAGSSNDRYSIDSFDLIVTNLTNAVYQGKTVSEELELIHKQEFRDMLFEFYGERDQGGVIAKTEKDLRFCIPSDIAVDGFIPRTPYVLLEDDPNWRPFSELEVRLLDVVKLKRDGDQASRRT